MFRQDKGYKSGLYKKVWNGREDNEYLVAIIHTLDASSVDFKKLSTRHSKRLILRPAFDHYTPDYQTPAVY
jgi:hypothetical protein